MNRRNTLLHRFFSLISTYIIFTTDDVYTHTDLDGLCAAVDCLRLPSGTKDKKIKKGVVVSVG